MATDEHEIRRPGRSRSRWMILWALAALLIVGIAFTAGLLIHSPWDEAIANSHARPVVTAAVESREFPAQTAEATGTVARGVVTAVTPQPPSSGLSVVTAVLVQAGSRLTSGQAIMEISGRPLIALRLPFSLFRDLRPGDSGRDVTALQESLRSLGHFSGTADGRFGANTSKAVRALYRGAGATAPAPPAEAQAALDEAQRALTEAKAAGEDTPALADDVSKARNAADTPLPLGDVVALAADEAEVVAVQPVGFVFGEGSGSAVSLRSGVVSARARVSVADGEAFAAGQPVQIVSASDSASIAAGSVTAISAFRSADTDPSGLPGYDIDIVFDDPAAVTFEDQTAVLVRGTTTAQAATGLSVPVIALRGDSTSQYVLLDDAEHRRIDIRVIAEADGYVLIEAEGLTEGARVIVGDGP